MTWGMATWASRGGATFRPRISMPWPVGACDAATATSPARIAARRGRRCLPAATSSGSGTSSIRARGKAGLPLSQTTLIERFREAGYATGLVGKWHLGGAPEFHPQRRGFDEFFGFLGGAHTYVPGNGAPIYRGTEVAQEKEYLTDAIARESVA